MKNPILLLAAGDSSRMGKSKGLLDLHGKLWIDVQLNRLMDITEGPVVVILGNDREEYITQSSVLKVKTPRVRSCHNKTPEQGPFSSLQTGLKNLRTRDYAGGIYVLPIDVPCPAPSVWDRLLGPLQRDCVAIPEVESKGGHPVGIPSWLVEKILETNAVSPRARLDLVIKDLPKEKVARIKVDDKFILTNLNTPEDWESFVKEIQSNN